MPRRIAHHTSRGPTKVPFRYVMDLLGEIERDRPHDLVNGRVSRSRMQRLTVNGGLLIPVNKLKPLFQEAQTFQTFKRDILSRIPVEQWVAVVHEDARLGKYVHRHVGAYANRRKLKTRAFIGSRVPSDVSSDESLLSISSKNDRSDRTNVNLPLSVCQGIQRTCRYYDDARRYREFDSDDSEDSKYRIDVRYR